MRQHFSQVCFLLREICLTKYVSLYLIHALDVAIDLVNVLYVLPLLLRCAQAAFLFIAQRQTDDRAGETRPNTK